MRILIMLLSLCWSLPSLALELNGQAAFAQTLALNSSVSARVAEVRVSVGQRVAAGELLLRFDDTALRAGRDAAQARVEAQAPRVDKARVELEKAQELYDRDSLALVELEDAQREFAIAEARLAEANAELVHAEYRLTGAELRAPIAGIVLAIATFPGHFVNTGVSDPVLLTLADDRNMIAQTLLPFENFSPTMLNHEARVTYRDKTYRGRVVDVGREISSGGNNHPAVRLRVRFRANGEVPAGFALKISIDEP